MCPEGVADRVNLGLIPSSQAGWFTACKALKPSSGGVLHIHENVTSARNLAPLGATSRPRSSDEEDLDFAGASSRSHSKNFHMAATSHPQSSSGSGEEEMKSAVCSNVVNKGHMTTCSSSGETVLVESRPSCDLSAPETCDLFSSYDGDWQAMRLSWRQWSAETAVAIRRLLSELHGHPWIVKVLHLEQVKSYAPRVDHLVLDLECRPSVG